MITFSNNRFHEKYRPKNQLFRHQSSKTLEKRIIKYFDIKIFQFYFIFLWIFISKFDIFIYLNFWTNKLIKRVLLHTQFKMAKTKIISYKFPKCIDNHRVPKIHQNHISPLKNSLFLLEPFLNPSSAHRLRFIPNNLIAQQHPQTTSNTPKINPNHLTTDHPLPTSLPSWRSSSSVFPRILHKL